MRQLFLVRHAKAVSRDKGFPDFSRSLVKGGINESKKMSKRFKKFVHEPFVMISSPANRALETAHIFARRLEHPISKIILNDALYEESSPENFLKIVQSSDDTYPVCILFGHEPSISEFAAYLLKNFDHDIPKAGIVGIEFKSNNWKNIKKGDGQLTVFDFPMNKTQKLKLKKAIQKEIRTKIDDQLTSLLSQIDHDAATQITQIIKKTSKNLASEFLKEVSNLSHLATKFGIQVFPEKDEQRGEEQTVDKKHDEKEDKEDKKKEQKINKNKELKTTNTQKISPSEKPKIDNEQKKDMTGSNN